jgi:uncharacterized protein YqgV (UPF0045/DUF77 family)
MSHTVNLAIQVLPLHLPQDEAYRIIDEAIRVIRESGLHHVVCPFETVIEGPYEAVMELVDRVQDACYSAGAESLLVNMKLHRKRMGDVTIVEKTGKWETA